MRDVIDLNHRPTMREIAMAYAQRHGVTLDDLKGRDTSAWMSAVRRGAMLAVHEKTAQSLPQIGRFFGGRDHTTVLYALRRAKGETAVSAKTPRAPDRQEAA